MGDINAAIINNTLGDDASVAELFKRQAQFAADGDVADDLRLQGQGVFNTALFTDTPIALQKGQPVVTVLRQTIQAIGALYLQNDQREAVSSRTDNAGGPPWRLDTFTIGVDVEDEATNTTSTPPQATCSDDEDVEKKGSKRARLAAAMEARKKRRLATHGTKGRMTAAAGVVKAFKRTPHMTKRAFTEPATLNPKTDNGYIANMTTQVKQEVRIPVQSSLQTSH